MLIVHVVRQFHPAAGGLEDVVLNLARAQVRSGHSVRVVTLNRIFKSRDSALLPSRETLDGIEVRRIGFLGSTRYPIAPGVLRHVGDADLVHVHAVCFFADFLAITQWLHGRRLVLTTHGGFFHTTFAAKLKQFYFRTITRANLTSYAGVVAVSEADHARFAPIRPHGLVTIENGADLAAYENAGSPTPAKTLIALGRFAQNKGLFDLIALLAALRARDPEWRLVVAGRPYDFDAGELMDAAERAGVTAGLVVLQSPSLAEIRRAMGEASFIVSASRFEGFGIAIVEGLSAGLLPCLSDIPPFRRLAALAPGSLILNFRSADETAARLLQHWARIVPDYGALRRGAMAAASRFDWGHVARRYEEVYRAALGIRSRCILGIDIAARTQADAVRLLDGAAQAPPAAMVAFANAHALNVARRDRGAMAAFRDAIVLNDGLGVDLASRLLFGQPFPENLNGTDFTPRFLSETQHRFRVFLVGGRAGVADRARSALAALAPQHQYVGVHHGFFSSHESAELVARIRREHADLVLVGMGNPRQELWLAANLEATGCRMGIAVGALFDFLAGTPPRAPEWLRTLRLEWVYRLWREPRRLAQRYLAGNPLFLGRTLVQFFSGARI